MYVCDVTWWVSNSPQVPCWRFIINLSTVFIGHQRWTPADSRWSWARGLNSSLLFTLTCMFTYWEDDEPCQDPAPTKGKEHAITYKGVLQSPCICAITEFPSNEDCHRVPETSPLHSYLSLSYLSILHCPHFSTAGEKTNPRFPGK